MATKQKKKEIVSNLEKIIIKKELEQRIKQEIEQGKIEGEVKSKKEIVINMHKKGFDINIISKITKLSPEEINIIINDYKITIH